MKFSRFSTTLLVTFLLLLFTPESQGQDKMTPNQKRITFNLRNNSWRFRKVTIITYEPGAEGNSASGFMLAPGMSRRFVLPEGTRLFNASAKQVDVVMSGSALTDKPLLVVKRSDEGKIIPLFH